MITSNRNNLDHSDILVGGGALSEVTEVNFLGVKLDNKLKFDGHVKQVTGKLARVSGILKKLRPCAPANVLKTVYFSLAYPYLSYGIAAWGNCGKVATMKLEAAQRCLASIVTNSYGVHNRPSIMNFQSIKIYFSSIIMHKILNGRYHSFLSGVISNLQVPHDHNTRFKTSGNLVGPKCRTTKSQQSFKNTAIKYWNSIPVRIRAIENPWKFKRTLKVYLFRG